MDEASDHLGPEELRGWMSRKFLAEDAHWAIDVMLSAQLADAGPVVALVLGHHVARIAHEGSLAIRSPNEHVGVAPLASLLDGQFSAITAQARHLTKMLDNTKKPYADVLSEFRAELEKHRLALTGNAVRWARWLETDLGLYSVKGSLLGATVPMAYRLGLDPGAPSKMWQEDLRSVTEEWGSVLAVLSAALLEFAEPQPTIEFSKLRFLSGPESQSVSASTL